MYTLKFKVEPQFDGIKAEIYLMKEKRVSRRLLTKLKRQEQGMTRNGEHLRSVDILYKDDVVELFMEDEKRLEPNPGLNVPIIYEDDSVVVFNKPAGMPVHPSFKHQGDTLGNYFAAVYPKLTFRPVNRLDRDTSGLCAVAKNAHAANLLQKSLDKTYFAVAEGILSGEGTIDAPIARERESIILRCVREDGQCAVTDYKVIASGNGYTFLRIKLHNGRTHQIRVHFSHIGHPLAGDELYGGNCQVMTEQALHCGELTFISPVAEKEIFLTAPMREDMQSLISSMTEE